MSVNQRTHRGRTDWYYQIEVNGRRIRRHGFETKRAAIAAEAVARARETKKHGLAHPSDPPPTLDVLLENFFALHCAGADPLSPKTTARYREQKPYLAQALLETAPEEITRARWSEEWARLLAAGGHTRGLQTPRPLSRKSVRNIAGMVSSAYSWGIAQDLLSENPVKGSVRPKLRKRRAVTVASADLDLILQADGSFWCRTEYLATADATGARRGELLALCWGDRQNGRFHVARNLIQVKDEITGAQRLHFKGTKQDEEHDVTIPRSLEPVLDGLRARQQEFQRQFGPDYQDHDLIFCQEDGRPLRPDSVSASISRLCRQLKLPKGTSLHSLRHTHASVLLAKGVDVPTVSARLGHKNIRTTLDIYGHVLRDADDKAAQAYDDYRFRQRQEKNRDDRVQ